MASRRWRSALTLEGCVGTLQSVLGPATADERSNLVRHHDLIGPGLADAVRLVLLGGVDPELATEAMTDSGVVEVVHGSIHEHEVSSGIDVAGDTPGHFGQVLDVDMLGDHHDRLGEHHQPESPE